MTTAVRQAKDVDDVSIALGDDAASIRRDFVQKLFFDLGKFPGVATRNDHYLALAYAIRDRTLFRWVKSARTYLEGKHRTVIYLSAEYLLGPQLAHNLLALGIEPQAREALRGLDLSLDEMVEHEEEPGLGNGGLGRLAACFMDSLATLEYPAIGHGIRYEFGIFDQEIRHGWQVEKTDRWLRLGNPWEIRRWDVEHPVGLGGRTEHALDEKGNLKIRWVPERVVKGVPYDTPALGYRTTNANFLRLWAAVASEEFDLDAFQGGEYWRAVESKVRSENITKVLYPNDSSPNGKQLRLEQQYFFVSCALQDCIRLLLQRTTIEEFADKFAIQLNDTHPTVAVPELMRLLMDVHGMGWDKAWGIVKKTFSYTNHTLMPEALETWPLPLFARLLPRHLEIIYEINRRFLDEVRAQFPGDEELIQRVSLIDERGDKAVRMANLATVASHTVNGVAALHSRLLTETVLKDFARVSPKKFTNVTNGVTPRRFLALANPALTRLVTEAIGDAFLKDHHRLKDLEKFADDAEFRARFRKVKRMNKDTLANYLAHEHHITIDPAAMLDAQCKRIHEYKRQHLAALHMVSLYDRIRRGDIDDIAPRTFLFAGKAAPAYRMAKLIVRLIHGIGDVVREDPQVKKWMSVVFFPDFNVKNAQRIYPAADLSEQISTAGLEASGTGNMKFAMNGALTIGTLDGANVEIREHVGAENFFLFGMTAEEVVSLQHRGYRPSEWIGGDEELARVIDLIASGHFSNGEPGVFDPLVANLRDHDPFCVLADFRQYVYAQRGVSRAWGEEDTWTKKAILNVANMGHFSSDRSIHEYATNVWRVPGVKVK
jgi:starch phosphorylase